MSKFTRGDHYVQINEGGVINPEDMFFPPVTERVDQNADPFKNDLTDYGTLRTTVQWTDNCNLRCPGCYAKPYLPHGKSLDIINNKRSVAPNHAFKDQITAHGPQLQDVYFLGLEPTLNPTETSQMMRAVHELGMTSVAATNGAAGLEKFKRTFTNALESGQLKRINISLDSIDPGIHNSLRGRAYAYERTMEVISYGIENNLPLQVTTTVWADNYHTILDTVVELYAMGVRGFVFHEGSLEGAPDHKEAGVRRVEPIAWRALTSKLEILKNELNKEGELRHFVFPYIYFTEAELRNTVIGDGELTDQYLVHTRNLESGDSSELPFTACPAVDVPQVYIFANDGTDSKGAVSLCNMHTIQTGKYFAEFDDATKHFLPIADEERNQMAHMQASPNLCPAKPGVTRDDNPSDRYPTIYGDLFHACRYISSNQLPFAELIAEPHYDTIAAYYRSRSKALCSEAVTLEEIDAIENKTSDYSTRTQLIDSKV